MKIAVYIDEREQIASIYGEGSIRLYDNSSGAWRPVKDVAFAIGPDMRLADVKDAVRRMVTELNECKIFLSAETKGLIHSLLQEELGFHTWASRGSLSDQLDHIAADETALAAREKERPTAGCAAGGCSAGGCGPGTGGAPCSVPTLSSIERVGDGHYRIDLIEVLKRDPTLNSRMALIPIMEEGAFATLEIRCDHIPRWFSRALIQMNLRADFDVSGSGVKVMVFPNH